MKIIYISDFFVEQIAGGGELVDDCLIEHLTSRGFSVSRVNSDKVDPVFLQKNKESFFIVSNFVNLSEYSKKALESARYLIYEHDHKYILGRDPSPYKDFTVPTGSLCHLSFYENAQAVVCQSKLHAEVLQKNIKSDNIISAGCTLWSKDHLEVLKKHLNTEKTNKTAVLDSDNRVKGRIQALDYCQKKNLDYELIKSPNYDEFIGQLASKSSLVFFSQVLESFCRLVVEARILGCKLITNKMNGCTSEDWFKASKGAKLLEYVENKQEEVIDLLVSLITEEKNTKKSQQVGDITVILNSYRRPYNLKMQIEALNTQTIKPKEIWLWVNAHEDNKNFDYSDLELDKVFNNDYNWKFYGRFAGALLTDTEYVAIFDDDTIPGSKWFENCLNTMKTHEGILGSAGILLNDKFYVQHDRCGWATLNKETTEVDLVGHAWFFKRDWLQYLWKEKPPTWDNAEDIQFAYSAQKYGNIKTYCPPHPLEDREMHGSILGNELGIDNKATSTNSAVSHQQFFSERDYCVQYALENGWKTVRGVTL